jgi:hypothetical protein
VPDFIFLSEYCPLQGTTGDRNRGAEDALLHKLLAEEEAKLAPVVRQEPKTEAVRIGGVVLLRGLDQRQLSS